MSDRLKAYRAKRAAGKTPEPMGGGVETGGRLLCVQQHAARNLHWDLRLEMGGTLVSWAVPKGPSPDPADKRLAMKVEDHPIEYGDFEGVIPAGQYGAGPVILWDKGTWTPLEDPVEGLVKGKLLFDLHGYKLRGRWTLVKTKQAANSWLFIKERDEHVDPRGTDAYPHDSIYSGLTVEERRDPSAVRARVAERLAAAGAARRAVDVGKLSPMLAVSADAPFSRAGWVFEIKLDGYRLLAAREKGEARLVSRNGNDLTATFPEIARAIRGLPYEGLVVDGEVVVHDARGIPSFQELQKRGRLTRWSDVQRAAAERPATFYAFDLLACEGLRRARARAPGAQGRASRGAALLRTDPLQRPRGGAGRGGLRAGHRARPRGDRREEGRRALSRGSAVAGLDQGAGDAGRRLRRRRVERALGIARRVRIAAPRAV